MIQPRNVAILLFDDVELLDFCGPFEVFSVAGRGEDVRPFNVYTVAEQHGPVMAHNGLSVNPLYTTADCPRPDILIVPGGQGTRREVHNQALLGWIRAQAEEGADRDPPLLVLSVCTGALLLARAGLLDGLVATTHHNALDLLRKMAPNTQVDETRRFVDNSNVILSAGISAGIDMSLYVVGRLLGQEQAAEAARHMEYDWQPM